MIPHVFRLDFTQNRKNERGSGSDLIQLGVGYHIPSLYKPSSSRGKMARMWPFTKTEGEMKNRCASQFALCDICRGIFHNPRA